MDFFSNGNSQVNARYRPSSLTFNDLQRRSDNSVLENQAKQLVRDILSNVDDILDDWKQTEPVDESANWLKQILENARYNKRRYRPGNL